MSELILLLAMVARAAAVEPPNHGEVLRALPPLPNVPGVVEGFRHELVVVQSRLALRVGPLVAVQNAGPGQFVGADWQCVVYCQETINLAFPVRVTLTRSRTEVVYTNKMVLASGSRK